MAPHACISSSSSHANSSLTICLWSFSLLSVTCTLLRRRLWFPRITYYPTPTPPAIRGGTVLRRHTSGAGHHLYPLPIPRTAYLVPWTYFKHHQRLDIRAWRQCVGSATDVRTRTFRRTVDVVAWRVVNAAVRASNGRRDADLGGGYRWHRWAPPAANDTSRGCWRIFLA